MNDPTPWSDQDIVGRIGTLLRIGVIVSALVLLAGGAIFLTQHAGDPVPDRSEFKPVPVEYSRPLPVIRAALAGEGRPMIQFGLLLLIATPVCRVAFSVFAFARQGDRAYVLIPVIVLAVLLVGLFFIPAER
jgi:uncharacterized membrane protein